MAAATILIASNNSAPAQVCPSPAVVNGTQCTVTLGTVVNVAPANVIGLNASGSGGQIVGDGITVNLGAATTTGVLAQTGSVISFNGSVLRTTATTTVTSLGQVGIQATGGGTINALGSAITMGPPNGTTVANNMFGALAQGGVLNLTNTSIVMLGGAGGLNNHALVSSGSGSQISYSGAAISTISRASFGVVAQTGGVVTIGNATITTTGVGTAVIAGSHALYATGAGSLITGTDLSLSTSGLMANIARAELGGTIDLTRATVVSSSTTAADLDPAGARVFSGSQIRIRNSTFTMTGDRGNGVTVQDSGSQAFVSDTTISTGGTRARAAFILNGGQATFTNSSLTSAGGQAAVFVQDAGSSVTLTDTAIRNTAAVAYGLRVVGGASGTMTGGSSTTEGRDSPGLYAANGGVIAATNVVVRTQGDDNAMGVLADGGAQITLNGGSVTTVGNAVRPASFPHALGARNPGGLLTVSSTTILTTGITAMGAVADDGGTLILNASSVRTEGFRSIGLYSITEQVGAQFPANLTATGVTLETIGQFAHGAAAQARNDVAVEKATLTVNSSTIMTRGEGAVGLRATLANYGTVPVTGRGEAAVIANDSSVLTEGLAAHGALSRDNPTSVTMNRTTVLTTGADAHGSVAQAGGLIVGNNATVTANGTNAFALFVVGDGGPVSNAIFSNNSALTNRSGPTIGVAGAGNITLANTIVSGSGQWLKVGTVNDFVPLAAIEPPLTGIPDPEVPPPVPPGAPPPTLPAATAGLANITVSRSILIGSAFTAPGSISNVALRDDSLWIMTGSSNLTNLINDPSLIQFTPPAGGADMTALASYKTLTVVNYIGEGGYIGLNTFLGTDGSASDRLIIDGGTAIGNSLLLIRNTTGPGAITLGNGILVVDAINGATTAPGAFRLGLPVVAGPYEYSLYRGSVDASNPQAWYLRNTLSCAGPFAPSPPCPPGPNPSPPGPTPPGPNPPSPVPPIPHYRAETSIYAAMPAMSLLYGRNLLDTLHERVGEEEDLRGRLSEGKFPRGAWGRLIAMHGERDGARNGIYGFGPHYEYDFLGFQAGHDFYRKERSDGSRDQAGLYFAIGRADGEVSHFDRARGDADFHAYSIGGYWTHFGSTGWYLDAIVQVTWYDATGHGRRGIAALHTEGFGFAGSLEGGYPFRLGNGFFIEPQVQIVYQTIDLSDARDIGALVRFSDVDSLAGRIGMRFGRTFAIDPGPMPRQITAWFRPNLWHEFRGDPRTEFSSADGFIPFRAHLGGSWLELNAGVSGQADAKTTLFANVSYHTRFEGRSFAFTGKGGVRLNW